MGKGGSLKIVVYAIIVVMLFPIVITVPVATTTTGYMTFPPVGFTLKWFFRAFQDKITQTHLIGDAVEPRTILEAVAEGYHIGINL